MSRILGLFDYTKPGLGVSKVQPAILKKDISDKIYFGGKSNGY